VCAQKQRDKETQRHRDTETQGNTLWELAVVSVGLEQRIPT